jgi:beta-xylosidase
MKSRLKVLSILLMSASLALADVGNRGRWGDRGDGTFLNPILPADYSDIDAIRVGADYYAISSTLQYSPGMAVLHSKDLVNWRIFGHVVEDVTQIGPEMNWDRMNRYGRGVWAGAIRHHAGRFWVYFGTPDEGYFVSTAEHPAGPWEPLTQVMPAAGWDDCCPFWDDDGQGYLVGTCFKDGYKIHLFKLTPDGKGLEPGFDVVIHQSKGSEANKLFKRSGFYYHYFSEVKPEGRVAMMGRARAITGPYEVRQLMHVDIPADREPNQGSIVQTEAGDWWFVTHQGTGSYEGRTMALLPVTWIDGWPIPGAVGADGIGGMLWRAKKPIAGFPILAPQTSDDFAGAGLGAQWEWNHQPRADKWSLSDRPGWLRLGAFKPVQRGNLLKAGNTLTQRLIGTEGGDATAKLDVSRMADGQAAGLCHFGGRYAWLGVTCSNGTRRITYCDNGSFSLGPAFESPEVWLRSVMSDAGDTSWAFSLDGLSFAAFGERYKFEWANYRGDRVGIFTYNDESDAGHVDVDWFRYDVANESPIDRRALVERHRVVITNIDERLVLQVGNGEFAFGADATGLQTFYGNTMSHWGWHTFPLPAGQGPQDLTLEAFDVHGRAVGYATSPAGQTNLYAWLRENPHRLNLGRLRFVRGDGRALVPEDVRAPRQELDLWRGRIASRFELDGEPVRVETCCHPDLNAVAARIVSPLFADGRLAVELAFPYGSPQRTGADWARPGAHTTLVTRLPQQVGFERNLDADRYFVRLAWSGAAQVATSLPHSILLRPEGAGSLEIVCAFSPERLPGELPTVGTSMDESSNRWNAFWRAGGAVDLSGSRDTRWHELERRIVLSQYLLAVNEAGSFPPQESGLFNNGWNGKFHVEMHWWHGVHWALWDRWPMFEKSLGWYQRVLPGARDRAASQGYRGARWPKMSGPDGRDAPSPVGPLLIWQQPHPIYYAELDYRLHPARSTLERWRDIVFDSAEFMASYAWRNPQSGRFDLGPPLKTVAENTDARAARNPAFELSYWRFGLRTAGQWRERLGLPRETAWDEVLRGLAPLPMKDGVYVHQEGLDDTYTKWNWEHPALTGPFGMLPGDGAAPAIMKATVRKVWATWQWDRKTWGWDFPMLAMAAARSGAPQIAVDALLHPAHRNRFNDAGLSEGGPFPYFPSNGGLLAAVAMMAAGWDGAPEGGTPGFPADGSWTVRWERLHRLP